MIKRNITLNGVNKMVVADPESSLADVLRDQLGLTGTKVGCGKGQCGSCSVIMDGKLTKSCITKMKKIQDGSSILTIEGIGTPDNLHALQLSWTVHGGAQCGFCSPGFIVSSKALLDEKPRSHKRASKGLVPKESKRLPVHWIQAAGGRCHGRRKSCAR